MKYFFSFILCVPLVLWLIFRIYFSVIFNIDCGGHMERAASANSIALATQEMVAVVKWAEDNKATSGYTSILWQTPDADVGFWYNNMKASLKELQDIKPDATELEKSNVLMKLRESVTHHNNDGTVITAPSGLSVFPDNIGFCVWAWIGLALAFVGVFVVPRLSGR